MPQVLSLVCFFGDTRDHAEYIGEFNPLKYIFYTVGRIFINLPLAIMVNE